MLSLLRGHLGIQITLCNFFLIVLGYGLVHIFPGLALSLQLSRFAVYLISLFLLLKRLKWDNAATNFLLILIVPILFQLCFNLNQFNVIRSIATIFLALIIYLSVSYERTNLLSNKDDYLVRLFSIAFGIGLAPVIILVVVNILTVMSEGFYGEYIGGMYLSNHIGWSLALIGALVWQLKSNWRYILIITLLTIVVQSGSRSSLLGLLLMLSVMNWNRVLFRFIPFIALVFLYNVDIGTFNENRDIAIISRTQRQLSMDNPESRVERLENVFSGIKEDPLLLISGLGQDGREVFGALGSYHSSLLFLLFSGGLIAGVPSIYVFYVLPLRLIMRRNAILLLIPVLVISVMEDSVGAGQFLSIPFYFVAAYSWQERLHRKNTNFVLQ